MLTVLLLAVPSHHPLAAQDPEEDRVAELRNAYHRRLAETIAPEVRSFVGRLLELERERAKLGDYAGAQRARDQAALVEDGLTELSPESGSALLLEPAEATPSGNVVLDRSDGTLRKWNRVGAKARWDLRRIPPGAYDVYLTHSVAEPRRNPDRGEPGEPDDLAAGGTIVVREVTNLARDQPNEVTAKLAPTGGWESFATRRLGTLNLESASATIEIEATAVEPEGVMRLRRVALRPSLGDAAAAVSGSPALDLEALRARFLDPVEPALARLRDRFSGELEEIERRAASAGDLDTALAARIEREHLATGQAVLLKARAEDEPALMPTLVLPAADRRVAQWTGDIAVSASGDHLTRLRPEGASIQWMLPEAAPLAPGFYEVTLRMRGAGTGGGTYQLASGAGSFSGAVEPAPESRPPFRDSVAGILFLDESAASLTFTVQSLLPGSDGLGDLASIALRLVETGDDAGDGDGESWRRLRGARLVTERPVHGDDFWIRHDGTELHLRLYGVDTPRVEGADEGFIESQMEHFGLSREHLVEAAGLASSMVREQLAKAPFIVFTRDEDADQGRTYAFVLGAGGFLNHRLVAEGLGLVDGPFVEVPAAIRADVSGDALEAWFREAQGRAARSRSGMWRNVKP